MLRGLTPGTVPAGAIALLLGWACAGPEPDVLAEWRGGRATIEDFETFVRSLPPDRQKPQAAGGSAEAWVGESLERLALRAALSERAKAAGLGEDPRLAFRARFLASAEVGRRLVRERCPEVEVPMEEARRVYEARTPVGPRPWILVRHIYKQMAPEAGVEERTRVRGELEVVHAQLADGASFVELAREHSDSETAKDGGLIGRLSRDAPVDPVFLRAAWSLADGETSGIVEAGNGLHVILREESGTDEAEPFDRVAERVRRQIALAQREVCGRALIREELTSAPVRFPETGIPLEPAPEDPLLFIGEETFTARQLDGLAPDGGSLTTSPEGMRALQQFSEAVLLARRAQREEPDLDLVYQRREDALRAELATERQRRDERRALVAGRPESELRAFFDSHRDRFRTEPELDLGLILLPPTPPASLPQALERAREIVDRARAGESFEELARRHSNHWSRAEGGRLGPAPWSRLRVVLGPEVLEAASRLAPGEVADPHYLTHEPAPVLAVVRLYGRQEPRERSFEEAHDAVLDALATRDLRELDREVRRKVLDESGFEIHTRHVAAYLEQVRTHAEG